MACDLWRVKIDACVDAELPAEERHALDAHLRACPSCTAAVLGGVQRKLATQLAGRRYVPSIEFRRRIEQQIAAPKRPAWLGIWLPRLAAAAAVVVFAFLAGNRWLASQREKTFGELADLHVATLASSAPVDVISSDRHTVKPWFEGKLPFTFNLPELEGSQFALLGGRVAYLDQAPGAQLLYQIRKHRICVFVFQDRPELLRHLGGRISISKQLSFTVEAWSQDGLHYFVIGDVSPEDIQKLSELFRHAARS